MTDSNEGRKNDKDLSYANSDKIPINLKNVQLVNLAENLDCEEGLLENVSRAQHGNLINEGDADIFSKHPDSPLLGDCLFFEKALELSSSLKNESAGWFDTTNYDTKYGNLLHRSKCWIDEDDRYDILHEDELKINIQIQNSKKTLLVDSNDDIYLEDLDEFPCHSKVNFQRLPDEIKIKVFSFFKQRELCRYIAPVCKSWFQLAKDSYLWQTILYNEFEDVRSDLFKQVLLSWCKHATKIEFNNRTDLLCDDFDKIFRTCSFVENISLAFCSQINNEILSVIGKYCKNLNAINLEGCDIQDESFYQFIGLPLQQIGVSHCTHITDEGAIFVAQNFKNLCHVNFDGIQWVTDHFIEILVNLHSATLEYVFLDGENLTDHSIELLSLCPNLRSLSFSFCTAMSHNALNYISRCKHLAHLQLRKGEHFTNAALLKFFQDMGCDQGEKFRFLNLAECTEISDECLYLISNRCRNLEQLDLSWCWEVSDDGLQFVIDQCARLKSLRLQGLHELFGIPFVHIPKRLPELKLMDLSQCNKVSDELIENLVREMRNLIVYNYYGEAVVNRYHYRSCHANDSADEIYGSCSSSLNLSPS